MRRYIASIPLLLGVLLLCPSLRAQPVELGVRGGMSRMTAPGLSGYHRTGWSVGVTAAYPSNSRLSGVAAISYTHHQGIVQEVMIWSHPSSPLDSPLEVGSGRLSILSASFGGRGTISLIGPLKGYGLLTAGVSGATAVRHMLTSRDGNVEMTDVYGSQWWWHPTVQVEGGLQVDLFPGGRLFVAPAFTSMFSGMDSPLHDYRAISLRGALSFGI